MEELQFYLRQADHFLQKRILLVFKSNEAKRFFENAVPGATFRELSFEEAENAIRIGIHGKVIPYGYTHMLTKDEMSKLSTANWERTAHLLAEGNERFYHEAKKPRKESNDE